MLPARRRAVVLASRQWLASRGQHTEQSQSDPDAASSSSFSKSSPSTITEPALTGAAKLFADAIAEESLGSSSSSRDHLRLTQGPIWDGDESQPDAVLRMLIDAHKPLRSGEGVKHDAADEKVKGWIKGLKMEPRIPVRTPQPSEVKVDAEPGAAHRTTIPPHLHRPWHSTYTGETRTKEAPQVKYGMFIRKSADGGSLANLMELQLPPNADGKTVKALRRAGKVVRRFEKAREGAIDYRLGIQVGEGREVGEAEEDETFHGNRQVKGSSVLGTVRGGASGLKAWAGLVEDRIQRARDAGLLKVTLGHGKPIPGDPEARNPHIETGELLMNRIVKRQGALPPWIELQNSLDSALKAFRATLLKTYTTHVTRAVISTNTLNPFPPFHAMPTRDEAWEAREFKFHQENIKQINELVRHMNAQAPAVVRRPMLTLEAELQKVRGDVLRNEVWSEVKRRAEEVFVRQQTSSVSNSPFLFEGEGLTRLKNATKRSLSTIARPVAAVIGKGRVGGYIYGKGTSGGGEGGSRSSSANNGEQPHYGVLVGVGLSIVGIWYYRKPLRADSAPAHIIPVHHPRLSQRSQIVATSPAEPSLSPVRIIQVYLLEPFLTLLRLFHLISLFGPVILTTPMLLVGNVDKRKRPGKPVADLEDNWGAVWWYAFLVKQMERAGPSFTKLGQWAASRADLFPAALCDKMSKLHSNGRPHSLRHTKQVIEKAFGLKFDEIFEEFEQIPIGCGAIAQVYKAKLKLDILGPPPAESGSPLTNHKGEDEIPSTSVAIKVLHPRVRKTIRRDIAIMSLFAKIINAFPGMEWISLPEEVAVFGEMMNSQLDLRVEASNLEHFDRNFRRRGRMVIFPRPIKLGLAAAGEAREEMREVLVEEYEDALPLKYFLRHGGGPYDDKIANIGLDAFLEMLLLDNWTHGDLHPGNIMVRFFKPTTTDYIAPFLSHFIKSSPPPENAIPTQSATANELVHSLSSIAHDPQAWATRLEELSNQGYEPQLIFIDAGLVTSLDTTNRRNFIDLFSAIADFDGYKAGKLMVERCRTPWLAVDEETFALKMQHIVLSVKSKTFSLAKIKISDILTDVLTAVRQHHVKLEADFVNTVISVLLLEGIGRQLDPNMDLFKSALPILRQLGRQMGSREAISAVPKGNIWGMLKIWVWIEARQIAGEVSAFDEWIKYDRLTPAI